VEEMKKLLAILFLLIPVYAQAGWKPVDFKKWQDSEAEQTFRKRIGGAIANYPNTDTSWAGIENDWITIADTLHTNRKALLKTDVNDRGQSFVNLTYGGNTYIVAQRMIKLIWINTDTWNWTNVMSTIAWNTPTVNGDVISWNNIFPGVNYKIQKRNATVAHGIFFKPAFLDSAVKLYNQRPDSLSIALGNVIAYELVGVDHADSGLGNLNERVLKNLGKHIFKIGRATVHYPDEDSLGAPIFKVNHRWIKSGNKLYCVEYVKMRILKGLHETYPAATLWHNDEVKVIDGTTNVEDNCISDQDYQNNCGACGTFWLRYYVYGYYILIRCLNVASELGAGATITGVACSVYTSDYYAPGGNIAVEARRIFKPWKEGTGASWGDPGSPGDSGSTYEDWKSDAEEWALEGSIGSYSCSTSTTCMCAGDDGSDNEVDGGSCVTAGRDIKSTAEDTDIVDASGMWLGWDISTDLGQGWYDGTINEEGVMLVARSGYDATCRSTEYGSNQPFWTFTYTTAAAGQVIIIH